MSNKEIMTQLLDKVPNDKIAYIIAYTQGLLDGCHDIEEVEPDEWDNKMLEEINQINDETSYPLEKVAEEIG